MPKAYFVLMIYNEEESVASVVKSIMTSAVSSGYEKRILAVNDGSTDRTAEILEELMMQAPLEVLSFPVRQGMPASFRRAFKYLEPHLQDHDIVFTLESDATNDIHCVAPMIEVLEKGADVVIASRYAKGAASLGFPWYRLWGSYLINLLFLRLLWRLPHVKDYSVLYRVYRGAILKRYIADQVPFFAQKSFAVISEILVHMSWYTNKFAEIPLIYDYNLKKGQSKMKLFQTLGEYLRIAWMMKFSHER